MEAGFFSLYELPMEKGNPIPNLPNILLEDISDLWPNIIEGTLWMDFLDLPLIKTVTNKHARYANNGILNKKTYIF